MSCNLITVIPREECIGDSRIRINNNFSILEGYVCSLSATAINPAGFVLKAGDTMTGNLSLPVNASPANAHAARTDYVNNQISTRVARSGDSMSGFLTLHANPSNAMHAATRQYVDDKVNAMGKIVAWVRFDGICTNYWNAGPPYNIIRGIKASFNVSSVVRNSAAGDYTIYFTNPLPNTNYIMIGNLGWPRLQTPVAGLLNYTTGFCCAPRFYTNAPGYTEAHDIGSYQSGTYIGSPYQTTQIRIFTGVDGGTGQGAFPFDASDITVTIIQ